MNVTGKFGDSRLKCSRDIRAAHFVMDEDDKRWKWKCLRFSSNDSGSTVGWMSIISSTIEYVPGKVNAEGFDTSAFIGGRPL